jgi:hypothetical protein
MVLRAMFPSRLVNARTTDRGSRFKAYVFERFLEEVALSWPRAAVLRRASGSRTNSRARWAAGAA